MLSHCYILKTNRLKTRLQVNKSKSMVVLRGKCIVVGDSTVGKSAVTHSFHSDGQSFPKNYTMSTCVELAIKHVPLCDDGRDAVDLFIFDNAGQEIFLDLCQKNWDKMGMYIIVFDLTDPASFKNVTKWLKKIRTYFNTSKTIPGILVGNKSDLEQRRQISYKEAEEYAKKHALHYCETSAKDYNGIDQSFRWLANKFLELYRENSEAIQQLD